MSAWVRLVGVRFLAFSLIFSAFPAMGAAWVVFRRSSRAELFYGAFTADTRFSVLVFASALAASCLWSLILAAGSTWVWRESATIPWVRILRVVACFYLAGSCIRPAFLGAIPFIGAVPFIIILSLLGAGLVVLLVLPRWRCGRRELAYVVLACALFYCDVSMPFGRDSFERIAGRRLNEKDVIILGFDSVGFSEAEDVLTRFTPPGAQKVVFSRASTPVAVTSAAWRTVFSGVLPEKGLLPGEMSARQHDSWLPFLLNQQGYETYLQQDDPSTNIYAAGEQVRWSDEQGWRWLLKTTTWRILFPLAELGGGWWVDMLGGEASATPRLGYSPLHFQDKVLRNIAAAAARGPILYASHTCLGHTPIHLTLGEVVQLDRWWLEPPRNFWGGLSLTNDIQPAPYENVARIRANTIRQVLAATLDRHASVGAIGGASVFVLSDHAPRVSWLSLPEIHHVMLAFFRPGPGAPSIVSEPVSLVDIAPTVRDVLKLPGKEDADGRSLLARCDRSQRRMSAPSGSITETPYLPQEEARPASLAAALVYERDGTYRVGGEMRKQIQRAMANESAVMESLKYLLERSAEEAKSQPSLKSPGETEASAGLDGSETTAAQASLPEDKRD